MLPALRSGSGHIGAAIHMDRLARDKARRRAAEEPHHRGDFACPPEAPEERWRARVSRRDGAAHRVDKPGNDAIGGDPGRRQFAGKGFGKANKPGFTGHDMRAVGAAEAQQGAA